jgi:LysM repeat protein
MAAWMAVAGIAGAEEPKRPENPIEVLMKFQVPDDLQFCGEPVPVQREDVRERVEMEVLLQLGNPGQTALWLKRMPRYFPMIEATIAEMGLPPDLKYVAVVESSLRPDALSRAGAAGPWQFMRGTGKVCGLEQNGWVDERLDWEKSTRTALLYLKDLHDDLGNWALALAAYNAGAGRVQGLMREQGQADYYGTLLPAETERYVFRAIAVKLITEDPGRFGIDLTGASVYPPLATSAAEIEVKRRLPVPVLADAAGMSYRYFRRLNPWVKGDELPKGKYVILVPVQTPEGWTARLEEWESKKAVAAVSPPVSPAPAEGKADPAEATASDDPALSRHTVQKGDTLTSIARRYAVHLEKLLSANGLTDASVIRPGQQILLPPAN